MESPAAAAWASTLNPPKANLREFLEKLGDRRKRVVCSRVCRRELEKALLGDLRLSEAPCRLHYNALREVLRAPPKGVNPTALRDLVEVAKAYTCYGDGFLDVHELLDCAIEVDPGLWGKFRPFLPALLMVLWLLLSPLVLCSSQGWSFVDGLYVGVMMMSTVGGTYRLPDNDNLKIFAIFFLPISVALSLWVVMTMACRLLLAHEARIWSLVCPRDNADLLAAEGHGDDSALPKLEDLVTGSQRARHGPKVFPAATHPEADAVVPLRRKRREDGCLSVLCALGSRWPLRTAIAASAVLVLVIVSAGIILAACISQDAGFVAALYWSIATCTTVGYGAAFPAIGDKLDEKASRSLQLVFVILAMSGSFFATLLVSGAYLHSRADSFEANFRTRRQLGFEFLFDLDKTGEGVGQLEFLCAGLMAKDKVSADELWEVLVEFWRLDVRGEGVLRAEQLRGLRRGEPRAPSEPASTAPRPPAGDDTGGQGHEPDPDWPAVVQALREQLRQKSSALEDTRQQLEDRDKALSAKERQLQQLQDEVVQARRARVEEEALAKKERQQREHAEQCCRDWQKKCDKLQRRADEAERTTSAVERQRRDEVDSEKKRYNTRLKEAEHHLEERQRRISDLERQLQEAKTALQLAQANASDVRQLAEAAVVNAQTLYAELDLKRQLELRNTLLHMQAVHQRLLLRPRSARPSPLLEAMSP